MRRHNNRRWLASGGFRGAYAIIASGTAIDVNNYGAVLANGAGYAIVLFPGGDITNQAGGTISGSDAILSFGAMTVSNAGFISGSAKGLFLDGNAYLTNQTGGTIIAGTEAVYAGSLTMVNAGLIAGSGASSHAIQLEGGGTITNQASGTISGSLGISDSFSAMTVVNAGTIIGTGGTAIQFTARYANLLTIDPGAVFVGTVNGGNTVSTLELASAATTGTLSGLGTQFIDFGQTTIDSGAYWVLDGTNTLAAGTTLTNAGTLALTNASFTDNGLVINDGAIVIDPSSVTLGSLTGSGDVTIDTGSTLTVTGAVSATETIVFAGTNDLLGANPTAFAGQINGFTFGDTIQLAGVLDGTSAGIVNGNTLEIQRAGNPPVYLTLDPTTNYTGDHYAVSSTGAVTEQVPCFVTGTLIRTDRGNVPVEHLVIGDHVVTLSGSPRPIRWVGHRTLDLTRHPEPRSVQPIAIRPHAFGQDTPARDLFLSPEHAVLLDGVLVPIRLLVNGASIQRDESNRQVTYYHIELETHDILLAEDLPVESYLETGNRGMFGNTNEPLLLHPDLTNGQARRVTQSCAPFTDDPTRIEPLWRALADRAAQCDWPQPPAPQTTHDPALHLLVDGRPIAPIGVAQGKHSFLVPAEARSVRLRSRTAIPSDTTPWLADDRPLGVMLRRLTTRSTTETLSIPLDHPGLGLGWWQPEWHDNATLRRWTDGDAVVPMPPAEGPCLLEVEVAATLTYKLPVAAQSDTRSMPRPASLPAAA